MTKHAGPSSEIAELKKRIKKLEKENNKLKSECQTLEIALAQNIVVLKQRAEHYKLEDLISQAEANKP